MTVARIKFIGPDGFENAEEILVGGSCMQHMEDYLANAAMHNLVENRSLLESRPWLYGIIPDSGYAEDEYGNIAIATWEGDYKFKPDENQPTKWGTSPNRSKK